MGSGKTDEAPGQGQHRAADAGGHPGATARHGRLSRRHAVGLAAAATLLRPSVSHAQAGAGPVKIGILSDVAGPQSEHGGVGTRVAVEMAATDFGGSVLGRPLSVMQADDQNKPDVANTLARQWIDTEGVAVLVDGAGSAAALSIQQVAREKKRIYLISSPLSNALVGAQCSPYGFQFVGNAYSLTKAVATTVVRQGGDTWFVLAADYELGTSLTQSIEEFVNAASGKVVGKVRAPVGTTDFSSYLLQAQASGAKVIGFALPGTDLQNCIKQASEFGMAKGPQRLVIPILQDPDIVAIGQDFCKGFLLGSSFFWNMTAGTRAWSERYAQRMRKPPNLNHASAYAAVTHWLKAVTAAGTLDADVVAAKMRELPVQDFYHDDVRIMSNGSVPVTMYLCEVKALSEATGPFDFYKVVGSLPSPQAFPAANATGCPLSL